METIVTTAIIFIIIGVLWFVIGVILTNMLYDCSNTYLVSKYFDTNDLFSKYNILLMLSGPLISIDILITSIINIKHKKRLLRNVKFKIDDRVIAILYNHNIKGKIVKIKVKNFSIVYLLEGLERIEFDERCVKLDRKSRIDNLYN